MRKLLVFALLFGAGLGFLLWRQARTAKPAPPPPEETEEKRPFTEVELGQDQKGRAQAVGVLLDGPLDVVERVTVGDRQVRALALRASDVDSLEGGRYALKDLELEIDDTGTAAPKARLLSPRATVVLSTDGGAPNLDRARPVELEQVAATLFSGAPVAPLHIESRRIDWLPADERYSSAEQVSLKGERLSASGRGLDARMRSGTVELLRAASIVLELESGGSVSISSGSEAGILLRRVEREGAPQLELSAKGGARLVVAGERPTAIDSATIVLLGRIGQAGEPFQLVEAVAEGAVVAEYRGDVFRADRAQFAFGSGGRLSDAELVGTVSLESRGDKLESEIAEFRFAVDGQLVEARFTGSPRGNLDFGRFSAEKGERARIDGLGPLVLARGAAADLLFGGPAQIVLEKAGVTLQARDLVEGHAELDGRRGSLLAKGDVRLRRGEEELASEDVELVEVVAPSGARRTGFISRGRTRLVGRTPKGEPVLARAEGGLQGGLGTERLRIDTARDVRVELGAPPTLVAQAKLLRDFDAAARSFRASGDVVIESEQGSGSAQEAFVAGPESVELRGNEASPARWVMADEGRRGAYQASAQGLSIKATPLRFEAEGAVVAEFETQDARVELSSGSFIVELAPPAAERALSATAASDVHASVRRGGEKVLLDAQQLRIDGRLLLLPVQETRPDGSVVEVVRETAAADEVVARTAVRVSLAGEDAFEGAGDRFWMHRDGRMRLDAAPGERLSVKGRLSGTRLDYVATADWIERQQDPRRIEIAQPVLRLVGDDLLSALAAARREGALLRMVRGSRLRVDSTTILLEGAPGAPGRPGWEAAAALVEGLDEDGQPWMVRAGSIRLRGDFRENSQLRTVDVQSLVAEGGFEAKLEGRLEARGERLDGVPGRVRFEGRPALMSLEGAEWESEWIQYDLQNLLLSTDAGEIRSKTGETGLSWALKYDSLQPFDQQDSTILALRNPRWRAGPRQMRADWTLFWVDRQKWRQRGLRVIETEMGETGLRATETSQQQAGWGPFADLARNPLAGVLSELYIEGNIEVYDRGERDARASAVYIDMVELHGWIQDGDLSIDLPLRDRPERVRVKADWLRLSSTPSGPALRAASAVITSCGYDHPHYVIETGDLRLNPSQESKDERVAYSVAARKNSIRFANGFRLPLPAIVFETDERGNPLVDRLVLGNSARLGASIRASINADLGSIGLGVGKVLSGLLRLPSTDIKGGWNFDVGLLGSRGVLLGAELDLRVAKRFRLATTFDVIPDQGEDKGLVRVDEADRGLVRTWIHARGRYEIGPEEWVDVAASLQSDPGVQSEFFESRYLAYEQKDNYLHWRKARGTNYWSATAKVVLEDRTDTEELPTAGAYVGRVKVGEAFEHPLYWTGTVDAGWLRRLEGDPRWYAPYADGLGERETLRISADQRIEAPLALGRWGLRATPYLQASARAWDQGVDPGQAPARAALIAGADLATTLWKRSPRGAITTITPSIGARAAVASTSTAAAPVHFDITEDPIDGEALQLGLRTRWSSPVSREHFDADARIERRTGQEEQPGDTLPLCVLAEYLTWFGGVPVGLSHDGRYDLDEGQSMYGRSALGFEPMPSLGFELSYAHGRDADLAPLFEAVGAGMRWRWTTKWEVQLQQSISLLDDAGLGNEFVLRRMGHDFVAEFEFAYRAGEGSSFGINILPSLSWRRSRLGLLDQWLGLYH